MERSRGIQSGIKKAAVGLFLAAALASTGCGQNALLNPTVDQIQAGENVVSTDGTSQQGGQPSRP